MLHQKDIVGDTDLNAQNELSDFQYLRKLLLGSEYQDLLELQKEFSSHSHTSEKISQVISEAIAIRSKRDNSISSALIPSVEDAIRASAKRNPKRLANALFPVMGPAIRESVAETVGAMMQQVNQLLENSLSARSIKWRIDAFRTNRTFAEVMLSETLVYQVEQVFLIHRESSLLINHLTSAKAIIKDPDMVSSMLTVVTDFVKDSFVVDKQQSVKSIKFGQLNLLFEAGPYAIIVAAVRGLIPSNLQVTLREQLEELHRLYGTQLETYDGNAEQFPDTHVQLEKCLLSEKKAGKNRISDSKQIPWPAIIVLCVLVLLPFLWWFVNKIEDNRWQDIVSQLHAESGIVVLDHYKQDGKYVLNALRDPLAKDPADIIALNKDFDSPFKLQMQSYYSNELDIVSKRLHSVLQLPSTVTASFVNGLLTIQGQAEPGWIAELPNKLPFIWGINSIDTSELRPIEDIQQNIQQLIDSIEEVVIEFQPNSSILDFNGLTSVANVYEYVTSMQFYASQSGKSFKLGILGFADISGTRDVNITISEQRARNVHNALVNKGMKDDDLLAKGLGLYSHQSEFNKTIDCDTDRCVVFEVYIN